VGFLLRLVTALLAAFLIAVFVHQQESHQASLFDEWIVEAARQWNVDPHLIKAVIWRESQFNPRKIGGAQERGLMQVTPTAGREYAVAVGLRRFREQDLSDPRTGIMAGAWYLSRALARWEDRDNPVPFALAEYNAGRSRALRWATAPADRKLTAAEFIAAISYPSTKDYVTDILTRYEEYRSGNAFGVEPVFGAPPAQ
jgi:soluble lytic murein transglycosylase